MGTFSEVPIFAFLLLTHGRQQDAQIGADLRAFVIYPVLHGPQEAVLARHFRIEQRLPIPQVADPDHALQGLPPQKKT